MQKLQGHWQLLGLTVIIIALWQTPVAMPVRLMIVYLHELSHVFAVILTGGEVLDLGITPDEGGHVLSRGGNRFVTLSAGYIGSLMIGVLLFLIAVRTRVDRAVVVVLGSVLIFVTLSYASDWFARGFGVLTGAGFVVVGFRLRREVSDLILRVIGLSSMIYVPLDIFSDTIARGHLRSDARMLAEEIGGTTFLWGGLWLILSVIAIVICLRYGLRRDSNIPLRTLRRGQST